MDTNKNYYSIEEVRTIVYSGLISKSTMHNLVEAKKIPVQKVCSRQLVPAWWVEQQIIAARTAPVKEVANG